MYYFIFSAVGWVVVLLVVFVLKPWEREKPRRSKPPICYGCDNLMQIVVIDGMRYFRCGAEYVLFGAYSCPSSCRNYTRNGRLRLPPTPPQQKRQGKSTDIQIQSLMTYDEYREAVEGAEQNYVILFDTDEQRERFIEALRAGGEAIKAINELRETNVY